MATIFPATGFIIFAQLFRYSRASFPLSLAIFTATRHSLLCHYINAPPHIVHLYRAGQRATFSYYAPLHSPPPGLGLGPPLIYAVARVPPVMRVMRTAPGIRFSLSAPLIFAGLSAGRRAPGCFRHFAAAIATAYYHFININSRSAAAPTSFRRFTIRPIQVSPPQLFYSLPPIMPVYIPLPRPTA